LFAQGAFSHITERYDALLIARETRSSAQYSLNELNRWIASARVITRSDERFVVAKPLSFSQQPGNGPLHLHRTWKCPDSLLEPDDLEKIYRLISKLEGESGTTSADDFVAAELYLKESDAATKHSALSLAHYWKEIIREPVIPFSRTVREEQLKYAYGSLDQYLPDASTTRARILEAIADSSQRPVKAGSGTQKAVKADCPHCGKPLRTPMAKQCRFCGADWHEPAPHSPTL